MAGAVGWWRVRGRSLATAALGAATLACSGPEPAPAPIPYFDLAAGAAAATVGRETVAVRFGTESASAHLERGWSPARSAARRGGRPFVWGRGQASSLLFRLLAARDLPLALEIGAGRAGGRRVEAIEVLANGRPTGVVTLDRGLERYTLTLPGAALAAGENRLTFRYLEAPGAPDGGVAAADRAGRGPRARRVAWYGLTLGTGSEADGEPRVSDDGDSLFVPFGTELAYLVRLEPDSELRFDRLAFRGGAAGLLDVLIETDEAGVASLARIGAGESGGAIAVPVDRPTPARLILRALATGGLPPDGASQPPAAAPAAGVLLAAPALWSPAPAAQVLAWRYEGRRPARPPHILIYLVDTLRPDRLGAYGAVPSSSPRLDDFAAEAVVFERAIGQSSWTRPSVASLFTGLWPKSHGTVGRYDRLPEAAWTLAEALREGGYRTVGLAANPNVEGSLGFAQGFDAFAVIKESNGSGELTRWMLDWLDDWEDDGRPLFLYVHTVDPHQPYVPPVELIERFGLDLPEYVVAPDGAGRRGAWPHTEEAAGILSRLYDAEILANDAAFGALLDGLRERGLYDESVIAFLSDHGEEFLEHGGYAHGKTLYAETLDIPLVIRFPGQVESRRVATPVQHADLLPTLLDFVGLPIPPSVEGRSLAAAADPRFEPPDDTGGRIYSHLDRLDRLVVSVVDGRWKLIEWPGDTPRRALFDLVADPGETRNLAAEHPIRTEVLAAMLAARLASDPGQLRREAVELDEELERSLRALGYLQ